MASRDIAGYVSPQWRRSRKGCSLASRTIRQLREVEATHQDIAPRLLEHVRAKELEKYQAVVQANARLDTHDRGKSEVALQNACVEYLKEYAPHLL